MEAPRPPADRDLDPVIPMPRGSRDGTYAPWLLLRTSPTDMGLRPTPAGEDFWSSPDIWLESTTPSGAVPAGQINYVWARVYNLGLMDAKGVRVEFWWVDPHMGLTPADILGNGTKIGTEKCDVDSLTYVEVRCSTPWTPKVVNNGHECLFVNCFWGGSSAQNMGDPTIYPFQPQLDRHAAQHNVAVITSQPGQSNIIALGLTNPIGAPTTVDIEAHIEELSITTDSSQPRFTPIERAAVLGLHSINLGRRESALTRYKPDSAPAAMVHDLFLDSSFPGPIDLPLTGFHIGTPVEQDATSLVAIKEIIDSGNAAGSNARAAVDAIRRETEKLEPDVLAPVNWQPLASAVPLRDGRGAIATLEIRTPRGLASNRICVCRFRQLVDGNCLGGYTVLLRSKI